MNTLLALIALATAQQTTYGTVADFSSLLAMDQFAKNGALQINELYVAFPDKNAKYRIVVSEGTTELTSIPMDTFVLTMPAFGVLKPALGYNGVCVIEREGKFNISLQNGSEILTKMDFSMRKYSIGDEYTGQTIYAFDGPWKRYGAFMINPGLGNLTFRMWCSLVEINSGKTFQVSSKITKAGALIAQSKPYTVSQYSWRCFEFSYDKPDGRTAFTPADLAKLNGNYEVNFMLSGKLARKFPFTVKSGVVQAIPEAGMTFSPRAGHILPKSVVSSTNVYTVSRVLDLYWLTAK